jgi:hypothetical protein
MKSSWDALHVTAKAKTTARSGTRATFEMGVARPQFDHQCRNNPSSERPTPPGFIWHFGESQGSGKIRSSQIKSSQATSNWPTRLSVFRY